MNHQTTILIVDDDVELCAMLATVLTDAGHLVKCLHGGGQVVKEVKRNAPDIILLDVSLPDADGMQVLKEVKHADPDMAVIMLTGFGGTKEVVDAIKAGAFDYIVKPFISEELLLVITQALEHRALNTEMKYLRSELAKTVGARTMIGESAVFQQMLKKIKAIARTNITVVIHGESGVGKELVAEMLHRESPRHAQPYIPVDCGAIPESLVESELFGHKKGAFTGAIADHKGKFEQAQGGTLFLDEVGNLPLLAQTKLLRVLEDRKVWCLGGGAKAVAIDVRIVAASNIDLAGAVQQSSFREDLFHRLNECTIYVPPLRERKEDIGIIANHFVTQANEELHKHVQGISAAALQRMLAYSWPGNIRELKNVVKMAVLSAESDYISVSDLTLSVAAPLADLGGAVGLQPEQTLEDVVDTFEKRHILAALQHAGGNKVKAAALLHLDRKSLYRKMSKLGIS
ncbi:MAG: sigma-54 dependent transcriptional regulator [bacterium]|nr:sigma-54 dependent transcriptional regulator [bacterium]